MNAIGARKGLFHLEELLAKDSVPLPLSAGGKAVTSYPFVNGYGSKLCSVVEGPCESQRVRIFQSAAHWNAVSDA